MNISNTDDSKNLISKSLGFYLYELLGVDYSGCYITNLEIRDMARKLGVELKLTDSNKMFGELLKVTKEENGMVATLNDMKSIFQTRIAAYDELAQNFPKACDAIEEWQIKAARAIRKIDAAIKEVQNESNSK
jgi:uncharacterized protein YdiU (UPF0061 family)